jgi:hypothetical protein
LKTSLSSCLVALLLLVAGPLEASDPAGEQTASRPLSFIPFVRERPCSKPYRQLAVSPPLQGTSDGGEGFPWRLLYGYCFMETGRMLLQQDWVVSYLDAEPQGDDEGGDGISLGTDITAQWQWRRESSVIPYVEAGGGVQYAFGTAFPAHGSDWTFTINAGAGTVIALGPGKQLNLGVRYLHMSNGGLLPDNAGYDSFHLLVGIRW